MDKMTIYLNIFFLIDKKQYIEKKNQEVSKSTQEVNKREPKGAKEEPTNPDKKHTKLPTPKPSQKIHKRVRVNNTIQIGPIPQIAQEIKLSFLSIGDPVVKHHPISFPP